MTQSISIVVKRWTAALDIVKGVYQSALITFIIRSHLKSLCCTLAFVNASMVQGSMLGPAMFVVEASDLYPKKFFEPNNEIC